MATFTVSRLITNSRRTKISILLNKRDMLRLQCICLTQARYMSPRKNSPFVTPTSDVSSEASAESAVPKRRAIPETLYSQPEMPKRLMKYNEYKSRIVMDSPGGMLSTYVPITRKSSLFTLQGLRQRWQAFKDFIVATYSIGIIKRSVKPFKVKEFAKEAEKLFVDVNTCLANEDKTGLLEKTTLTAYYGFVKEFFDRRKTFQWRFIATVDRPRVVHAAVSSIETKQNLFAQVIVRVNINQVSAVMDQNDRLVSGDPKNARDLLEYIVLERHLGNDQGTWKVCGKLFPKDQP